MASRPSRLRRLTLSVLLPLILLFSQQGALLHELSHWHAAPSSAQQQHARAAGPEAADLCLTCLAYAQVAGLAHFAVPALPAATGLRYHYAPEASRDVAEADAPAPRSRGPPPFS